MLRDILRGQDAQVDAVVRMIAEVAPDIILLQNVDYDLGLAALTALRDQISEAGPLYTEVFALRPNTGMTTRLDMDGDGRLGEPEDAQGYGEFSGQGGMALLSRYPVEGEGVRDFSQILWREVPNALLPTVNGLPFPSEAAQAALRLSTTAHWVVPIRHPSGPLTLMAFHAGAPVFDGVEDRNGRRNHDQIVFWQHYMDGAFGPAPAPDSRFVLLGHSNQDSVKGEGIKSAITGLLADPRLQDPRPARPNGGLETVDWSGIELGELRVSYVLPSRDWQVVGAGVHWPVGSDVAGRHRIVWVDLALGG
ncbi:endonuclease/exonuclease/phosphatase family protein [Roseovarius carneus]|uniref:endonuclease/exonuclease/phosphatase family protein n=1 Tax=Roseovarius carneus TaxID=2853164 RepID=UPI001CCF555C|nr:endonuclease/exonuclease/phosphatase family protein [Roseovarius carneus]